MQIMSEAVMSTDLPLQGRRQGKVRDIYQCETKAGQPALLIIASDRVSAFDVVMSNGIPGKGVMLTKISTFWFDMIAEHFKDQLEHHLISTDPADVAGLTDEQVEQLKGRVMVGRRAKVVPIECVVRGYLAGSGWKEYQKSQTVCSLPLPAGLTQCDKLPEPIFTPSTKEDEGHDENISFEKACELVGEPLMNKIDEVMTPDSSRFWPADQYKPGRDQPSFDKQIVRNYLQELVDAGRWDKMPPGPELPNEVVTKTLKKYQQAFDELTGSK